MTQAIVVDSVAFAAEVGAAIHTGGASLAERYLEFIDSGSSLVADLINDGKYKWILIHITESIANHVFS